MTNVLAAEEGQRNAEAAAAATARQLNQADICTGIAEDAARQLEEEVQVLRHQMAAAAATTNCGGY